MTNTASSIGYDVGAYFALAECGILAPDDRVELLDGLIVSMAPASPLHNAAVHHVQDVLLRRLPPATLVRTQMTFVAAPKSVTEPDVAVLPGRNADYLRRHPARAHLVVEVSDTSLAQDRLTKAAIYAKAGVSVFWIVNLRETSVECFSEPDQVGRRYRQVQRATGSDRLRIEDFPGLDLRAEELFPGDDGQ